MKRMPSLSIASKLLAAFAAMLAIATVLGVFSIGQLGAVNGTAKELGLLWMPKVRALLEVKADLGDLHATELNYLLSRDPVSRHAYQARIGAILTRLGGTAKQYRDLMSTPDEITVFKASAVTFEAFMGEHGKLMALVEKEQGDAALLLIRGDYARLLEELNGQIDTVVRIDIDGAAQASRDGEARFSAARWSISAMLAGSLALGLLLATVIARAIARPLRAAAKLARRVADGDLGADIEAASRDETGQMMDALRDMNGSLVRLVRRVRTGTETIAGGSERIAAGNLDLSRRTQAQAGTLEATAASMAELTAAVRNNAASARQASELAAAAAEVANQGGQVVSRVIGTMGAIDASARRVIDIIAVIDGIAFQTNILALNAAVEAARAGEQGRGFAVVAAEVRTLAQRAATAAREIKTLTGDSVERIDDGTRLVGEAEATMQGVVDSIRRVTDCMGCITLASQEQSEGIERVNRAIGDMDQATQQNAALVEETAAAAESLREQAGELVALVHVFRLGEGDAGSGLSVAAPAGAAPGAALARPELPADGRMAA
ncbi:methyl-accepting chemotaxis protein [Pseudoduganella sp. LjRoot289]|uniref:methyl-accepting chemotaxis protein n=1 Tax=Pseudoduganella sp. LjRoot289 TaxID=3342314 RepID=UPI003ECE2B19